MANDVEGSTNAAKTSTSAMVSDMRTELGAHLQGPNIAVPHFSMIGSFNAQTNSVPSVSVSWYAHGAVFDRATIIPTMSGYKGVGEAGPEAVSPVSVLQSYISDAVSEATPQINYDLLAEKIAQANASMNVSINLDNRELGRVVRRAV